LRSTPIIIPDPSAAYIKSQLETTDSGRTKRALQYVCRLYRTGHRFKLSDRIGLEQSIVGILYTRRNDEKLRRWALNALARCGTPGLSLECVLEIFKCFHDDPQTAAAAIAALYRMHPSPTDFIESLDVFDPQMRVLAALQHVHYTELDLRSLPVDVEIASSDILKLSLIVVGLSRAPSNLFHPRHSNAEIVKALGNHDDSIVAQYTVWAVAENDDLSISDLGIPINSIESLPSNVRAWMYRAVAMCPRTATENQDYIANGAGDEDAEARLSLAIGLKDTFFDGLEAIVIDWFFSEGDVEVQHSLLDHMVRHAQRCQSYHNRAIELYESEGNNSLLRRRMEGQAAKTPIYREFRRIAYDGSGDLFGRSLNVTNKTVIHGNVTAGTISINGNAESSGTVSVHFQETTLKDIQAELSKAIYEIHKSGVDPELKEEVLEQIRSAQANPTSGAISKSVDLLTKFEKAMDTVEKIGGAAASIGNIISRICQLTGYLPF